MDEEALNVSVRKFLRTVGITAQREIEEAVRAAAASGRLAGGPLAATATFTVGAIALTFSIDGELEIG